MVNAEIRDEDRQAAEAIPFTLDRRPAIAQAIANARAVERNRLLDYHERHIRYALQQRESGGDRKHWAIVTSIHRKAMKAICALMEPK